MASCRVDLGPAVGEAAVGEIGAPEDAVERLEIEFLKQIEHGEKYSSCTTINFERHAPFFQTHAARMFIADVPENV
jgi:hypothetical protein